MTTTEDLGSAALDVGVFVAGMVTGIVIVLRVGKGVMGLVRAELERDRLAHEKEQAKKGEAGDSATDT